MKKYLTSAVTLVLFVIPAGLMAGWGGFCRSENNVPAWGRWFQPGNHGHGAMFFLLMLLISGFLSFLCYTIYKTGQSRVAENPIEILKLRYARGRISREEFERMTGVFDNKKNSGTGDGKNEK